MADEQQQPPADPQQLLGDPHRTTADARLIRRAVRNGWSIPPEKKKALMERTVEKAEGEEDVGKFTHLMRVVLEMNSQDLRVELEEMKSEFTPPPADEEVIELPAFAAGAVQQAVAKNHAPPHDPPKP